MVDYRLAMIMTRAPFRGIPQPLSLPIGFLALILSVAACSDQPSPSAAAGSGASVANSGGGRNAEVPKGLAQALIKIAAAGQQDPAALPSVETKLVYEFEEWYDDFPYTLHVPQPQPGLWYDRNSQAAVEKVVANLSGLCSKPAWLMSKQFFDRHWDRSQKLLVETLDETQRRHDQYDWAENIVNVMGRCESGLFAEVLLRAAVHNHPGIRTAAFRAIRNGGDEAAVLKLGQRLGRMSRVEQIEWVKAAAGKLSDEKLFPILRDMLMRQEYAHLQNHAFEAAMKLPAKRAAKLFEPFWSQLAGDLQLYVAGLMHSVGDGRGTARLRAALKPPIKIVKRKMVAIQGVLLGNAATFTDELLELTSEDHEGLNVLLITALRDVPGDNVTDSLIIMTDTAKPFQVRQAALQALVQRGVTSEFKELMETLRTSPRNSKFRDAVADVVAAKYGKAATVLLKRSREGSVKEQVFYVRMIANIGTRESFLALKEIFMRPEYRFTGWRERHTNVTFLGVQFSNLKGSVDDIIGLLGELPRKDYRRRAALIHALANVAGAYPKEEFSKRVYAAQRKIIFDAKEVPQLRILALDYLRKDILLADAMKLKIRMTKESEAMRKYFSDYLTEFF